MEKVTMGKKILWILYQPYKFGIFVPFLGLFTAIFGVSAMLLSFTIGERIASLSGVIWAKVLGWTTPIFVTIKGKENIDKKQSYVIVSNHQSQYDIFLLYGWVGIDFKWVMKQELRKVPILGLACDKVGHIFIDRSNTDVAFKSINAAKKKITGGTSVLFFPEGVRSKDGNLLDFKKGAFRMALDLELPILPITINNTHNILPAGTMNLFPGKANMIIHPAIDTKGYHDENITELMNKVRDKISSKLTTSKSRIPN